MEYLYGLIILIFLFIAFYFYKQDNSIYGNPEDKKEQIENEYINTLNNALQKASSSQEKTQIKMHYIKKYNDELSRNIFFTAQEAKELLQRLSSL